MTLRGACEVRIATDVEKNEGVARLMAPSGTHGEALNAGIRECFAQIISQHISRIAAYMEGDREREDIYIYRERERARERERERERERRERGDRDRARR